MTFSRDQISQGQVSDEPDYIESLEGCEEYISAFLSGRTLFNQKLAHVTQKNEHDVKYEKEVELDREDNAKGAGPIQLKQYRKENNNTRSKCNAQYANNIHCYYGNGSNLKHSVQNHYAVDYIFPNGIYPDSTSQLKTLENCSRRKKVSNWICDGRKDGAMSTPLRRSVSCCEFLYEFHPITTNSTENFQKGQPPSIFNLCPEYQLFFESQLNRTKNIHYIKKSISNTMKNLITNVNVLDYSVGWMQVSKVLFSIENLCAYAVPVIDIQKKLRDFSNRFENWLSNKPPQFQSTFGTGNHLRSGPTSSQELNENPYYVKRNVIMCLSEYADDGTQFRRARHVCEVYCEHHLYLEIDTGMLRILKTSTDTIRLMPQEFAFIATPLLEVRFKDVKNHREVASRISDIRDSGMVYIGGFDQKSNDSNNYKGRQYWNQLETAVLPKLAKYTDCGLTTMFCQETNCMGFCGIEKWIKLPQTAPVECTPVAWVCEKKRGAKNHFYQPPPKLYLKPAYVPPQKLISSPPPPPVCTSSYLEPCDMGDFFKR